MMKQNNNKIFPKIQKNLKAFLNDEEGKITKKNLGMLGAGLIALGTCTELTEIDSAKADVSYFHNNGSNRGHLSYTVPSCY